MQNPWHKLTLGGFLTTGAAIVVNTYDPTVVPPKVAGIVALAGLAASIVGNLFHTSKVVQDVTNVVQQIAGKQAGR